MWNKVIQSSSRYADPQQNYDHMVFWLLTNPGYSTAVEMTAQLDECSEIEAWPPQGYKEGIAYICYTLQATR